MPSFRLAGELKKKSKLEPKAGVRPCRVPVRPHGRSGPTYTVTTGLSGPAVHV